MHKGGWVEGRGFGSRRAKQRLLVTHACSYILRERALLLTVETGAAPEGARDEGDSFWTLSTAHRRRSVHCARVGGEEVPRQVARQRKVWRECRGRWGQATLSRVCAACGLLPRAHLPFPFRIFCANETKSNFRCVRLWDYVSPEKPELNARTCVRQRPERLPERRRTLRPGAKHRFYMWGTGYRGNAHARPFGFSQLPRPPVPGFVFVCVRGPRRIKRLQAFWVPRRPSVARCVILALIFRPVYKLAPVLVKGVSEIVCDQL